MKLQIGPLPAGLYLVATPIGTARDITLRALDILGSADVLAAEDTRTLRRLMDIHGLDLGGRKIVAYHDHSDQAARDRILAAISDGKSVAYASEAGTPMIADPGFALVRDVNSHGLPVTSAPGPSAVITALTIAGLPTDRFLFAGFAPNTQAARRNFYREFANVPATLAVYESPKRVHKSLADMELAYGADRQMALCRELTKKFEEVIRGPIDQVRAQIADRTLKGEIVLCVDRNRETASAETLDEALNTAMATLSLKDAVSAVSDALGLPRRQVYQAALKLAKSP